MAFMKELCINRYRGIRDLKMENLKQVNLLVGDNNCGKTSALEALQLLRTSGSLANIYNIARQRDSLAMIGTNSLFSNFICMFPKSDEDELVISVNGICNDKDISFLMKGKQARVLLDTKELLSNKYRLRDIPDGETEADAFDGELYLKFGDAEKKNPININQYSIVTGTVSSEANQFNIIYMSPFAHLRGGILNRILISDSYKQICIKALQLFDPDIEDMLLLRSDIGDRPVEYLRHKTLGNMPVSSYGDGIKKVLALSNAIAMAAEGILLIDEIETAIHKKYYDDIFRFVVKACKTFNVQVFITTHSIEAIDGLLATQDYELQQDTDDICVCTIKRDSNVSYSRVLSGREVFENREAFGFEVRL